MGHQSKVDRSSKGKSLVQALDTYVAFDIETTGFSPITDEIIEIGAVLIDNGLIVDTFSTFVRPTRKIPDDIVALTGITDEMVSDAPTIDDVLNDFLKFIGEYPLVGHNVSFDVNFIYDGATRCFGCGIDNDHVNTIRIARKVIPHLPNYQLGTLLNHYGIQNENAHRALSDAKATFRLYEELKKYMWFGDILPESAAFGGYTYEDVFESIKFMADDNEPNIELKPNKNYASIYMFGSVAFEVRINSRSRYIETDAPEAVPFVSQIPDAYTTVIGSHRFPIATASSSVPAVQDMVRTVHKAYYSMLRGEPFGCCNDHVRCSDAKECLHKSNPEYSGCYYRKNLEAGRIFYGRNKNI